MPFIINKWKTKDRISHASFKWRKETKLSETSSKINTVTYRAKASGRKAVAKLERLVKRLNKYKVDPEDIDTINHHLEIVNKPTPSELAAQNTWLAHAMNNFKPEDS